MRRSTALMCLSLGFLAGCPAPVAPPPLPPPAAVSFVATSDPYGETVKKLVILDQNWSVDERNRFYYTEQGSQLIPYDWFLHLEQADSEKPFRDTQNILKYRYLPQNAGPLNPDGLPVGFVGGAGAGAGNGSVSPVRRAIPTRSSSVTPPIESMAHRPWPTPRRSSWTSSGR